MSVLYSHIFCKPGVGCGWCGCQTEQCNEKLGFEIVRKSPRTYLDMHPVDQSTIAKGVNKDISEVGDKIR